MSGINAAASPFGSAPAKAQFDTKNPFGTPTKK